MKRYFSSDSDNKAAMILASMSPDMVADIVDLVLRNGRSIQTHLHGDDGPPRPLAILSSEFVSYADFPVVYYGVCAMMLAEFRTLKYDNDFYEKTLMNAFALPVELAAPAAKRIETYDVLGGGPEAIAASNWFSRMGLKLQEGIRRATNLVPNMLNIPWENDQDQSYDIDFLYELSLLGKCVDDLQSRARLMKGQAALSASLGLFVAKSGTIFYLG